MGGVRQACEHELDRLIGQCQGTLRLPRSGLEQLQQRHALGIQGRVQEVVVAILVRATPGAGANS